MEILFWYNAEELSWKVLQFNGGVVGFAAA